MLRRDINTRGGKILSPGRADEFPREYLKHGKSCDRLMRNSERFEYLMVIDKRELAFKSGAAWQVARNPGARWSLTFPFD